MAPPISRAYRKWPKCPHTRSYNTSPQRGILINTLSSPSDDRTSIGLSRPPVASTSIMSRVAHFEASRRTRISFSSRRVFGLSFVEQPMNPMILWWTAANPRTRCNLHAKLLLTWPPRRPDLVLVLWSKQTNLACRPWLLAATLYWLRVDFEAKPTNRRARLCGATEEPDSFVGTPLKIPRASFGLTAPSIRPAKPFTSGSRTVYSVLPHLTTWPLPCTGSMYTTSSCSSCHHVARTWSRRPSCPSNQAYLSLHSLEATQA
jgi:hypothetical protein